MKVAQLLESRRENWRELEQLCMLLETRRRHALGPAGLMRFGSLYRSACADLALADAYQLPPNTVHYLHQLVGRAHNQLYRSRRFNFKAWGHELFVEVPQRLFNDNFLRVAFLLFWGVFLASMGLAASSGKFAADILGTASMEQMQEMFAQAPDGRSSEMNGFMAGFYIKHNTSIGLECFAGGMLLGVGGLFATVFNAGAIGASFGHMLTVPERNNFLDFVTAHGPFELTAIVVSAAAGMRLGFSMINTGGLSRAASLRKAGRETMPIMGTAIILFALAALIEGFLSPSAAPYFVKAAVAMLSAILMMFYFVVLGYPKGPADAAR